MVACASMSLEAHVSAGNANSCALRHATTARTKPRVPNQRPAARHAPASSRAGPHLQARCAQRPPGKPWSVAADAYRRPRTRGSSTQRHRTHASTPSQRAARVRRAAQRGPPPPQQPAHRCSVSCRSGREGCATVVHTTHACISPQLGRSSKPAALAAMRKPLTHQAFNREF